MERKNIIVVITETPEKNVETYSNFKKMCEVKQLPYHSLKSLKFPFVHKELIIYKTLLQ